MERSSITTQRSAPPAKATLVFASGGRPRRARWAAEGGAVQVRRPRRVSDNAPMLALSDFHLGADVVAGDGRKVGTLASVIVGETGFDPRALVVKEEVSFAGRLRAAES